MHKIQVKFRVKWKVWLVLAAPVFIEKYNTDPRRAACWSTSSGKFTKGLWIRIIRSKYGRNVFPNLVYSHLRNEKLNA